MPRPRAGSSEGPWFPGKTIVLPGKRGPLLEPALGLGMLDLRIGPNAIGLESLRLLYASLGLRAGLPILPGKLAVELGLEGRLGLGANETAEAAYGPAGLGRGLGLAAGMDVSWTPLRWLRLSLGWTGQRMVTRFEGGGTAGWSEPKLADTIHDVHAGVGVALP